MYRIFRENYKTYQNEGFGEPENHFLRLFAFIIVAALLSIFSDFPSTDTFALLVTFLSVLTGFVFTALFSDHALAEAGLPAPRDETDREDIRRLKVLGVNLTSRAKFFILVALLCCANIVIANFDFSWLSSEVRKLLASLNIDWLNVTEGLNSFSVLISILFLFFVLILAFEAAYTFFRLAETMLAVLAIRREYLSGSR